MLSESAFSELAFLARLDPEDAGLKELRQDFNKILDAVKKIEELDLSTETSNQSIPGPVSRPDESIQVLNTNDIGKIAPAWELGHFIVPGVIQSE